jgi:ubiquinone/menaquinone biosynthesis C-methylase UbiE
VLRGIVLKSFEEAQRTIERDRSANRGVFRHRTLALLVIVGIALSLVTWWALVALAAVLVVDFAVFLTRRARVLRDYSSGTPRLETEADFRALAQAYEAKAAAEQTMTDWERAAGFGAQPDWRTDLRYRELLRARGGDRRRVMADVGTGDGRLAWSYGIGGDADWFIGIDIGADGLRTLKSRLPAAVAIQAEGSALPLQDGSVDFLSCTEVLRHVPRPEAALREFARVLAPGGRIVIQSPAATRLRNLNPLHVAQCVIGIWLPVVLLPKVVHEHTWTRAYTYDRDFTRQQLEGYCVGADLNLISLACVTYRFNPDGNALHRWAYAASRRLPIVNQLGWDMTAVFEKPPTGQRRDPTDLESLIACPRCRGAVVIESADVRCPKCHRTYPIRDGVLLMMD